MWGLPLWKPDLTIVIMLGGSGMGFLMGWCAGRVRHGFLNGLVCWEGQAWVS